MNWLLEIYPWLTDPSLVVNQSLNGISIAATLVLMSTGLSLTFGVARVLNLAHGALFMLGAQFMVIIFEKKVDSVAWFWASMIASALLVAVISFFIEYFILRRIYKRGQHLQLILTFGISLMIGTIAQLVFGSEFKKINRPESLSGMRIVLDMPFPDYSIFMIIIVAAIMVLMWLALRFTRWGLYNRALSTDKQMLEAVGIDSNRVLTQTFVVSSFFAGMAGALVAPIRSVDLSMGMEAQLLAFVVIIVGGMGSIPGAILGALIVGQLNSFGILMFSKMSATLTYLLMIFILLVRPFGLLGKSEGRVEDEGTGT